MGARWSLYDTYTLGEPFQSESSVWEVCPARGINDDEEVTVFIHDKGEHEATGVDNAVKYLRTLRHPGLLKCHDVFEESSEVAVITEAVVPLVDILADLNIHEVVAGLHDVIVTLAFLHEKCKLSHNNLSLESIFVGQNDACWKIGGFENTGSFSGLVKEKSMNESIVHAKDALSLGKLISDILEQVECGSTGESTITSFQQRIQEEILEASLEKRPNVGSLLNDEIFQIGYCQILDFLRNITVKTSAGKAVFFSNLHTRLHELPPEIISHRLLHLLLSRFVLIDPVAVEVFLPHLLTPLSADNSAQSMDILPLLPEQLYRECCVPILQKLFEVNDRHVRLILLKYFHLYVAMFDKHVLKCVILPELRLGLQDSDDELVSATFSALQYLVPLLGAEVVIGGERIQQFTERRPKFDSDVLPTGVSGVRVARSESSQLTTSKVKASEGKSLQDKIQERERRREETKRRNEERRKQRQHAQMERKLATKATVVERVQEESGEDFDTWDSFEQQEKGGDEISDDSEQGRPSSSEISLDSGFSERPRQISEQAASTASAQFPQNRRQNSLEETTRKSPKGKTSFGMKLGKKDIAKIGKNSLAKENNEVKLQSGNSEENIQRNYKEPTKKSGSETLISQTEASKSPEVTYDDVVQSGDENFRTNKTDFPGDSLSQTRSNSKSNDNNIASKKTSKTKSSNTECAKDEKTNISQAIVDKPWDDFGIKVTKKRHVIDDIFADMTPNLSETRKAPVKGTSMYSDSLAVVASSEDVDGWADEEW